MDKRWKSLYSAFLFFVVTLLLSACAGHGSLSIKSEASLNPKFSSNIYAHLTKPEGEGPFPTVILMHGCDGLSQGVMKGFRRHAEFFRENGYASIILDSFRSRGAGGLQGCTSELKLAAARFYRTYDAFNALTFLKQQSFVEKGNVFLYDLSNGAA